MSWIPWTDERTLLLREFWAGGRSASEIAALLEGVTRSAVLGKLFRLGLVGQKRPKARRQCSSGYKVHKTAIGVRLIPVGGKVRDVFGALKKKAIADLPLPPEPPRPETFRNIPFNALEAGECKFLHGDPQKGLPYLACGCPAAPGTPYCTHHLELCYTMYIPARSRDRAMTDDKIRRAMRVIEEGVE